MLLSTSLIFINVFQFVALMGLLVVGLIFSRKYLFKAGFYFFLLLIIGEVYSKFIYDFIQSFLRHVDLNSREMGLALSLIPQTIKVFAFLILIVGLYRTWKRDNNLQ